MFSGTQAQVLPGAGLRADVLPGRHAVRPGRGDLPAGALRPGQHREHAQALPRRLRRQGDVVHARGRPHRLPRPHPARARRPAPPSRCSSTPGPATGGTAGSWPRPPWRRSSAGWATGCGSSPPARGRCRSRRACRRCATSACSTTGPPASSTGTATSGLSLTVSKHPSYLPLELMACGAAVVAFDNPWGHWLLARRRELPAGAADGRRAGRRHRAPGRRRGPPAAAGPGRRWPTIAKSYGSWDTALAGIYPYLCDPEGLGGRPN